MSLIPNYVPSGYKTVNVMLVVKDAKRALHFYNQAFGAEITMELEDPNGKMIHAEFKIADTIIMLSEGDSSVGGTSIIIHLYTGDVESCFESALAAGAQEIFPIKKQFFGDRSGRIRDPFGHEWVIATHMEDFTPTQIQHKFNELYN